MILHSMVAELKSTLTIKLMLYACLFILSPILILMLQVNLDPVAYFNELNLFYTLFSGYFEILFIPALSFIYAYSMAEQMKDRYITYERIRLPAIKMITAKFFTNALLTFAIVFLLVLSSVLFSFYIAPALHVVPIDNYLFSQHPYDPSANSMPTMSYFEPLLVYHPLIFGIVHGTWAAFNAVLWSSIAFCVAIIFKNNYVVVLLPFLAFMVLNLIVFDQFNLAGLDFMRTAFLFNYRELPIHIAVSPVIGLLICLVLLMPISVHKMKATT